MKYLVNLDRNCAEDIESVGGKAKNLAELCKIEGIYVPPGLCVKTNAFNEFSKPICLPAFIYKIEDIQESSEEIRKIVKHQPIPSDIEKEIQESIEGFQDPFAVRSSAVLEDSLKYSFAGQQDSFLNVHRQDIADAVRSCWASLYNARALSYRVHVGINEIGSMGVIVQEMVQSKKAGVIATSHPVIRNLDVMFINANWGFGESVVLGHVNPDEYLLRKSDGKLLRRKINKKSVIACVENEILTEKDISKEPISEQACLSEEDLSKLYYSALKIERHFGNPQDIEFAIDNRVAFVQSRPLKTRTTTLNGQQTLTIK